MTIPKPPQRGQAGEPGEDHGPAQQEPGSNAVEHEPDPDAKPIPDGEHRSIRRSPYTAGNT
jgi:hypothetical protein